jgi:hypothetical protein
MDLEPTPTGGSYRIIYLPRYLPTFKVRRITALGRLIEPVVETEAPCPGTFFDDLSLELVQPANVMSEPQTRLDRRDEQRHTWDLIQTDEMPGTRVAGVRSRHGVKTLELEWSVPTRTVSCASAVALGFLEYCLVLTIRINRRLFDARASLFVLVPILLYLTGGHGRCRVMQPSLYGVVRVPICCVCASA